jgi:hypothetical protein
MQRILDSDPAVATPDAPAAAALALTPCDAFPPCPSPLRHPFAALGWLISLVAGLVSLVALLAVIAAIPIVNLIALGYMLEGEGRVVRSGRLRDGLPLAALLPRLGAIAGGTWACLLVVRLVASAAADAGLVDPGGPVATAWRRAATLTAALVGAHLLLAWHAGGSLASFVRPLHNLRLFARALRAGTVWSGAADRLSATLGLIRPLRLFTLGLRGFIGAAAWLVPATLVFSAFRDTQRPVALLVTLLGALLLGAALVGVPIMQALFAADGRLAAFRDVSAVRRLFRRAPWALVAAVAVLHALSLPLYLAKVVVPPRDALWLVTPIFVLTIYPARLVVGLATGCARRRTRDRWAVVRWAALAVLAPLLALDLLLLFFMPAIDALGRRVLFDHHALLLPTPF